MEYIVNIIYELENDESSKILCDSYNFTNMTLIKKFIAKRYCISTMLSNAERELTFEEFLGSKKTIIIKETSQHNIDTSSSIFENKCFYPTDTVQKIYDYLYNNLKPIHVHVDEFIED